MSFTGDLEHLPIVDVVQLLHSTRKSGILRVKSRKGESQLVFKDGGIVSANHLNNKIRIGQILVEMGIITQEVLLQALEAQKRAGSDRKPLVVTLLDLGLVKEDDAYKGLEQLIEKTVVEILTWKKGTFTLDVLSSSVTDEYKYYPQRLSREINVDTQGILMDALRIFDEKMRDGELEEEPPEDGPAPETVAGAGGEDVLLSADDLGLSGLDTLEKGPPDVFTGLEEPDATATHREKVKEGAPGLSRLEEDELVSFLGSYSVPADATGAPSPAERGDAIIFFSGDPFMLHAVTTVCTHAGRRVLAANEEKDLDPIIDQSLAGNGLPMLVIDIPIASDSRYSPERIASLRQQKRGAYPRLVTVQLAPPGDAGFSLLAYADGARAVLPRPCREERRETFVSDTIRFLRAFHTYVRECPAAGDNPWAGELKKRMMALREIREAPEVAYLLLQYVAELCGRSLTLVVREGELVADRGIGIKGERAQGKTLPLGFRIPLARPSLLRTAVETGSVYFGSGDDGVLWEFLFAAIAPPSRPSVLLLPVKSRGKTVALIYGDFGGKEVSPVETDLLEILAIQAEQTLDNLWYRKKMAKTAGS